MKDKYFKIGRAEDALAAPNRVKDDQGFSPEDISALITDLAHYAEHKDYNLQEIIRIAALKYEAERGKGGAKND